MSIRPQGVTQICFSFSVVYLVFRLVPRKFLSMSFLLCARCYLHRLFEGELSAQKVPSFVPFTLLSYFRNDHSNCAFAARSISIWTNVCDMDLLRPYAEDGHHTLPGETLSHMAIHLERQSWSLVYPFSTSSCPIADERVQLYWS